MKTRFTPGPYSIDFHPENKAIVYLKNKSGDELATLYGSHFLDLEKEEEEAQTLADARLLAAAPEMYDALEQISKALYVSAIDGKKVEPDLGFIFNLAGRVLAKARGES